MFRGIKRAALAFFAAGALMIAMLAAVGATPASAYGKANWQATFAGTVTFPGGGGFGFWGWCAFAGGVSSGNSADCQFAQYSHAPTGGFTCHESVDGTSWTTGADGDFLVTGTVTVTPSAQTGNCLSLFPGTSPFSNADSGIPASPGHFSPGIAALGFPPGSGAVGEYNITVTEVA
jgi:hypothetical protein